MYVVGKCILFLTKHHFQYSKKEAGRHVKNAILRGIQKISKKQFAVRDKIHRVSKQFLIQIKE